jgi:hypothetical protein
MAILFLLKTKSGFPECKFHPLLLVGPQLIKRNSVCRDNAQQAHALIHWKYALNEWVIDQLENEGYLTPDKLAEREKMKAKKRRDHANEVVDGWEATGIIKNLYRDFKSQLEAARESKQGRWEKVRG